MARCYLALSETRGLATSPPLLGQLSDRLFKGYVEISDDPKRGGSDNREERFHPITTRLYRGLKKALATSYGCWIGLLTEFDLVLIVE